ncbi:MAG: hypothetical protein ACOCXG_00085 [Nanoarchaeota archaeon]
MAHKPLLGHRHLEQRLNTACETETPVQAVLFPEFVRRENPSEYIITSNSRYKQLERKYKT